jgi:tRNA 2-selenouridine synthase
VWVEAESKKIGNVQLPPALLETMHMKGKLVCVKAPMAERVILWREDYHHFEQDPDAFVSKLASLRSHVGGKEFEVWQEMARSRQIPELFERVMVAHYDPTYARSTKRSYPALEDAPVIDLQELSPDSLRAVALALIQRFG